MRALIGVLGWLVAAVAVIALIICGLCGLLGLAGNASILGVAAAFALPAGMIFLLAREVYRWGFRRTPPLDRSQGGDSGAPPSSAA